MTLASEVQKDFRNLRAISVVDEKFPGRLVPAGSAGDAEGEMKLLRLYFRGLEVLGVGGDREVAAYCAEAVRRFFGRGTAESATPRVSIADSAIAEGYDFRVSVWESALPEFPERFLEAVEEWKGRLREKFGDNLIVAGAAFNGAGLHVAAESGMKAAAAICGGGEAEVLVQ